MSKKQTPLLRQCRCVQNITAFLHAVMSLQINLAGRHNRGKTKAATDFIDTGLQRLLLAGLAKQLALPVFAIDFGEN